jgi:hypothetical protein
MEVPAPKGRVNSDYNTAQFRSHVYQHLTLNENKITIYEICSKFPNMKENYLVYRRLPELGLARNDDGTWSYSGDLSLMEVYIQSFDFHPDMVALT